MVVVAQLVRASDCGSECRGFESRLPPLVKTLVSLVKTRVFSLFSSLGTGANNPSAFAAKDQGPLLVDADSCSEKPTEGRYTVIPSEQIKTVLPAFLVLDGQSI